MDSSTHIPPYKRLFKLNKTLSLKERTGHFGSLLSIFPVDISVQIEQAVRLLSNGGIVGLPTETVYGLAGSIESEKALKSIFEIKERPFFDPLIVHVSDVEMLKDVTASWPKLCSKLAEEFWPGPLTIVTEKNSALNPLITSGLETVAVRMPAHPVALALISKLGTPVAAPSANKFGKTSPTSRTHVMESFPNLFSLEGGDAEIGLESTVVRVEDGRVTILRPGYVTAEELKEVVGKVEVISSPHSPGHLESHYRPDIPLVMIKNAIDEKELAWCLRSLNLPDDAKSMLIELDDDAFLSARTLYHKLRQASNSDADYIICRWKPEWSGGMWEAIADRLKKASSLEC